MQMPLADVIGVLESLISIDSINSDLIPGAAGEAAVAAWCGEWLAAQGFEVQLLERTAGHPSVVAIARGSGGGPSLMLNGHLDTVGVDGYRGAPMKARIENGRIFGRGAFDMKSGVAAILVAAADAVSASLAGDVLVTLVADEEFGSRGTEDVLSRYRADAAIVVEPTNLFLALAHRGFAWFEVEFTGLAAHGSMPEQGVDAVAAAFRFGRAVDELRERLESQPAHPLLGHGAVRVSTISGGSDPATVAASCLLSVERRTLPGEFPERIEDELRDLLVHSVGSIPGLRFELRRLVARAAFETDAASPIVVAVAEAVAAVTGSMARVRGEPFWTDAGLIAEAGIPCLVFGVDGGGAHADEEWAEIESVHQVTAVLAQTIRRFCGSGA